MLHFIVIDFIVIYSVLNNKNTVCWFWYVLVILVYKFRR